MKHFSGAVLFATALPTNIRLGWKSLPGTNTLAFVNYVCKKFYSFGPRLENFAKVKSSIELVIGALKLNLQNDRKAFVLANLMCWKMIQVGALSPLPPLTI